MILALARVVLASHPELLESLEKIFDKIGRYSGERNAAAHTMWVVKLPEGVVMPYPSANYHRRLKVQDHKKQFERLLNNLGKVFREIIQLDADIAKAAAQLYSSRRTKALASSEQNKIDTIKDSLGEIR